MYPIFFRTDDRAVQQGVPAQEKPLPWGMSLEFLMVCAALRRLGIALRWVVSHWLFTRKTVEVLTTGLRKPIIISVTCSHKDLWADFDRIRDMAWEEMVRRSIYLREPLLCW